MDPKQAVIDLLEALAAKDCNGAEDALMNLTDWIRKGGFMPESIHRALEALRADAD